MRSGQHSPSIMIQLAVITTKRPLLPKIRKKNKKSSETTKNFHYFCTTVEGPKRLLYIYIYGIMELIEEISMQVNL